MLKIDKRRAVPQSLLYFFPADNLSGAAQQNFEDLKRLTREPEPRPVLAKFTSGAIVFKRAEDDSWRLVLLLSHAPQFETGGRGIDWSVVAFKDTTGDNG